MEKYNLPENLIIIDNLKIYDKVPGVWAIYGRNNLNEDWQCLQVCETKDIKKEISIDRKFMLMENKMIENEYKSTLGGFCFKYNTLPNRRQALYIHIKENYKYLVYVLVKKEENEKERKKIEENFAEKHNAKYWCKAGRPQRQTIV